MRIHVRHVRDAGHLCAPGLRAWCTQNGVDLRKLCREGLPVEDFAHLHDEHFAASVIAAAEREAQANA